MAFSRVSCNPRTFLAVLAFALVTLPAYAQVTLTGAIEFSANSSGSFSSPSSEWHTLGDEKWFALWLALNPDASSPVNGPSDAQAGIAIPLVAGSSYQYYIFGAPGGVSSFSGLNLFFDGNGSAPGISVFGAMNTSSFLPNSGSTLALQGSPATVMGSGTLSYSSGGVVAVLVGYNWNAPATPPGDVCQPFAFFPAAGDVADFYGSFTLRVFPAATLTSSLPSASPGTEDTLIGSGFAPEEQVNIHLGVIASPPIATATTNASGGFAVTVPVPTAPYGPEEIYAVGQNSSKLGVASIFITPGLAVRPREGTPGSTATTHGVGFGAGETVDVYWGNPRQLLGSAIASSDGSFVGTNALKITIPTNAPPGTNAVVGIGQTTGAIGIGKITVE